MTSSTPEPAATPPGAPRPSLWSRHRLLSAAVLACALAAAYWGLIASDRYVSEARVIIQRTDLSGGGSMDFTSLLNMGGGGNRADQLLLRDHLLSLDMLRQLEQRLQLRQHYSTQGDWLSRLWDADAPLEAFMSHFRSRVSVELDEYAGVLSIRAQAYTPEMAQAIAATLVTEGELKMNAIGHALAQEQVGFLEQQVTQLEQRAQQARAALLAYQNRKGLVSPQATAENIAAIVNRLEAQLSELQTRRASLLGYLQPGNASVVEVELQIRAVERQITAERARLASPGGQTLNLDVEEFGRLEMEAGFAQEVYRSALVALEKGRVEATRTLKKVSVLQAAGLPEYPLQPRRLYNFVVFAITAFLLAGVLQLLLAIVKDHKD
ncbi:chain-length determining protein [Hydrogenophaga sp.]|uniref:chain-length determining protein n=1 Tax=Hydrogenophaga sp. TaxID=1904254 RepID=UPI002B6C1625|nr:chain-length determining protein [Hydrogenophaga sp.]HMP10024.1 chain-length determining protein [Hydrogenophaga sp.]